MDKQAYKQGVVQALYDAGVIGVLNSRLGLSGVSLQNLARP